MDRRDPPAALDFARALSDETRQELMRLCCCEWRSVGELARAVGVTQPTVSHHLAFLRDAGLVEARRRGRQTFYTLDQQHVAECCGRLVARFAPEIALNSIPLTSDAGEEQVSPGRPAERSRASKKERAR